MKKRRKRVVKIIIVIEVIIILVIGWIVLSKDNKILDNNSSILNNEETKIDYNQYFNSVSKTLKDKKIYLIEQDEFKEMGLVYKDVILNLEKNEYLDKGYFKIKDTEYYIDYQDIKESEEEVIDSTWKNYIPFNESIKTIEKTNLYLNDRLIYTINEEMELPIIIKEINQYGVIYKDRVYYIKKDEGNVFENVNTDLKHTSKIAALVYHFVYDSENPEEKTKCLNMNSTICLSDTQLENQFKYIKEHNFYTATMKDIEMFVDGKVQLPEKTTLITIDDGNLVSASIKMLEKYDLHATLFLIGVSGSPEDYKSNNLEIHSHTWNMHNGGVCNGGQGSEIKCLPKEQILEDLKKSRESLNNTTYFCWPFFEYNDYSINILKEAGFTMAFIGGRKKIQVGMDKLLLPRYGIVNTTTVNDIANIIN